MAMLVIVVSVAVVNLVQLVLLPFEAIVAGCWRETFFLGWSVAAVVMVLALGLFDPLPRSPLTLPLFMPLLFAGLSYPVWTAIAVSGPFGRWLSRGVHRAGQPAVRRAARPLKPGLDSVHVPLAGSQPQERAAALLYGLRRAGGGRDRPARYEPASLHPSEHEPLLA